jgi:4-hydroxybenzoate polyprenyltransferase
VLSALRLHQWAKNLLIFLPLLLGQVITVNRLLAAMLAFCCFSLTASLAYIVNDLTDIEADRHHARKRLRPFAAGDLPAVTGLGIAAVLLLLALAGSAATQSHISHWLASFSIFLFFSLAIAKRFAELQILQSSGLPPRNGRGYLATDIDQLRSSGAASAFAAIVIFAICISNSDIVVLYRHAQQLWLIMPLMILWLCRVWLLASRGELNEDPLVFALTDWMSVLIGAVVAAIRLLAI